MNLVDLMKGIYRQFSTDEVILRLLSQIPINQSDNPLDRNKPNVLDLPIEEKFKIIDNVIYAEDKKFKLDLQSKFSRINFYLDERKPERIYSNGARKLVNNPLVSRQEIAVDIFTNIEINRVDMRIYSIVERVNFLLSDKNFKQFTGMKFDYGYVIRQTADGFIGYRMVFYVLSPQEAGCDTWNG